MTLPNAAADLPRLLSTLRMRASDIVVLDQGAVAGMRQVADQAGVEVFSLHASMARAEFMNFGARLAASRRKDFVGFCEARSILNTDVIGALLAEMELDARLGVVAPARVARGSDHLVHVRARWDLAALELQAETQAQDAAVERLEADYCDLAFGLVRMSAWVAAGGFDAACDLHLVDADFGLRVRRAGYSCAYLPQFQIGLDHGGREPPFPRSASLSGMRQFAGKLCGHPVAHAIDGTGFDPLCSLIDAELHPYLQRYGMLDPQGPELLVSRPGAQTSDYLFTPFAAPAVAAGRAMPPLGYKAVFTTSASAQDAFRRAGVPAFHVPLGIETDHFNPFGARRRFHEETTYLLPVRDRSSPAIRSVLEAWRRFRRTGARAHLVIMTVDAASPVAGAPDVLFRAADFRVARHHAEGIDVYEPTAPLTPGARAQIYRSVDFTIVPPDADMTIALILETFACGTPAIHAATGPAAELGLPNGFTIAGVEQWDAETGEAPPYAEALLACLHESLAQTAAEKRALARAGLNRIRNGLTWRDSALALGQALDRVEPSEQAVSCSSQAMRTVAQDSRQDPAELIAAAAPNGIGRIAARKLRTASRLAEQAAATWERQGLMPAARQSARRLGAIALHKLRSTSAIGRGMALRSISQGVRKRAPPAPVLPNSALLVGYIDAALGLGQSLRGLALALETAREPFAIYPFAVGVEGRRGAAYMPERYDTTRAHEFNIIEVAANELNAVFAHLSANRFDRSYTILRTYWELGRAPEAWRAPLQAVDEIWAPNAFVASSFRTIFDKVITIVPPCIEVPDLAQRGPDRGGDARPYEFLFSFDFHSFPQRKNPLGVVRAFHRAFPDPMEPVGLTVKATGAAGHHLEIRQGLHMAARHDPRIRIIDRNLERDAMIALLRSADCYVSLHRSEGFGLGMVEAMAMAKPVIATAYSGNVDFIREDTAFPVSYRLRSLMSGEYVEWQDQVWAEPDEADAAAQMRRVFADRVEADRRAQAGCRFVREHYGPRNVGHVAAARLAAIRATWASGNVKGRSLKRPTQ